MPTQTLLQPRTVRRPRRTSTSESVPRTSIDTLRLFASYRIVGAPPLTPTTCGPYSRKRNQFLYYEPDGTAVYALRATWKDGAISLCIAPLYENSKRIVCKITFSPARVLYGGNERVLTRSELIRAVQQVQTTLLNLGIVVDLDHALVSRVDIFRHLYLRRPQGCHVRMLHFLTIKNSSYATNYRNGIRRGNKSCQLNVYDKGQEMLAKGSQRQDLHPDSLCDDDDVAPSPLRFEGTVLRAEWRLRCAEAVQSHLNIKRVHELYAIFDTLDAWLDQKLSDNLFRESVPDETSQQVGCLPLDRPTNQQRWEYALHSCQGKPVAINETLMFDGYERRMHEMKEAFWRMLRQAHTGPRGHVPFAKLQAQMRRIMLRNLSPDGVPYAVLYQETKNATFALPSEVAPTQHKVKLLVE